MQYSTFIDIKLPLKDMIRLFDEPKNRLHWQPELKKMTHLSGIAGQIGAQTTMVFHIMGRNSEMIETITASNLPHSFEAVYKMKGIHNIIKNEFEALSETESRWTVHTNVTFSGMMSLVSTLLEGVFRRQTDDFCKNFKVFAEKQAV